MLRKKLSSGEKNVAEEQGDVDVLRDKIKLDADTALRNHDQKLVGVLRYLISLIDKKALQLPPGQMSEAEEVSVLRKELKNKQEAKEMFVKGNRADLVAELDEEIEIVKKYLPVEMNDDQVRGIVDQVVADIGSGNFGMVMGMVMKKVAGQVGGDVVSRIVKEKLGQ